MDIDCPYDIAKLFLLISSSSGLTAAEELISVTQSEDFGIYFFWTKIKNAVDCISLLSSDEQVSFSKESFKRIEMDNPYTGNSKAFLFRKDIKYVLEGLMEYAKQNDSFCFK